MKNRLVKTLLFALLLNSFGCQYTTNKPVSNNGENVVSNEFHADLPFATKEPENFRAEFVFKSFYDAEDTEPITQKTIIYRNGNARRIDFEMPDGAQLTKLQMADGKEFVINPKEKVFAEIVQTDALSANFAPDYALENILHTKPFGGRFEKVGAEKIGDYETDKYKLTYNADESAENVQTEIFVWHSMELGFPVKTEVSALENGQKNGAVSIMELQTFTSQTSPNDFALPSGFKQISISNIVF